MTPWHHETINHVKLRSWQAAAQKQASVAIKAINHCGHCRDHFEVSTVGGQQGAYCRSHACCNSLLHNQVRTNPENDTFAPKNTVMAEILQCAGASEAITQRVAWCCLTLKQPSVMAQVFARVLLWW